MTGLEVTLIIVGIVFVIASFFIQEKLSQKDIDRIVSLSERELKIIVERQLHGAKEQIDETIEQSIGDSMELAGRAMEREMNGKVMAIDEYSNTVMDSMNKTHNEILFLYSMLNDKHTELKNLVKQTGQVSEQMKSTESEVLSNLEEAVRNIGAKGPEPAPAAEPEPALREEDGSSHKELILSCYEDGMSAVEIARELGLGSGEVKLVIDLYKGETGSAV